MDERLRFVARLPYRQANRLPFQVETLILALKREHPSWGAPKIRAKLRRRFPDRHPSAWFISAFLNSGPKETVEKTSDSPTFELARA